MYSKTYFFKLLFCFFFFFNNNKLSTSFENEIYIYCFIIARFIYLCTSLLRVLYNTQFYRRLFSHSKREKKNRVFSTIQTLDNTFPLPRPLDYTVPIHSTRIMRLTFYALKKIIIIIRVIIKNNNSLKNHNAMQKLYFYLKYEREDTRKR